MAGARQQVLDALTDALISGSIQTLRVADLLREAHVNRSTFYYHFGSLADVYKQLIEDGLAPIEDCLTLPGDVTSANLRGAFREAQYRFYVHCKERARLYHALLWGDLREQFIYAFIERMEQFLMENYRLRLDMSQLGKDSTDDAAYHMLFYRTTAYQQFSILETWAAQDFEQPCELVAEVATHIILPSSGPYSVELRRAAPRRCSA